MTDKEKLEKLVAYLMRRMYAHNQMADIGSTGELFDEKIENAKYEECRDTLNFIDSMQKEPVSEDFEQAIDTYLSTYFAGEKEKQDWPFLKKMVIHFAEWQKEQFIKRLCNHANIDKMVEKFEDKYKPEKVLDTEYYKRGIFDTIKTIKEE